MVVFKMGEAPNCSVGWPKTNIGYPNCETERGAETTLRVPELFTYCCYPAPCEMGDISGVASRHLYRDNVPKPRGVHSYYNVMWDGHVRRGDPAQRQARKEEEECDKIRQRLNRPRKGKSLAERLAEKKALARAAMPATPEEAVSREMARYAKLELSNLVPKDPTKYLIDLSDEIDVLEPCYKGKRLPTLRSFPIAPSLPTNLEDRATQAFGDEFFDFDRQAVPILARIVGAVVDQARLEILEEEELASLINQHERHLQRIQDAKDTIARWKLREELRQQELERQEEERRRREEDSNMMYYNICAFSGNLTKDAINDCIKALTKEGYLISRMKAMMDRVFVPWLNDRVHSEVQRLNMSRDMLNYLIKGVADIREAEYADSIWKEVYEESRNPIKALGREGTATAPPPTPGTSWMGEGEAEVEARVRQDFDD